MAEAKELVEVKLDRPYSTNGQVFGYEDQIKDGKKVKVFTGIAKVTGDVAEDLERRQAEYRAYEASLNNNKGHEIPVIL